MTGGARPRLLVLTPDFPPAFGGIQLLVSRLVESFERFDVRVVALDQPGAESFDQAGDLEVVRTPRSSIPKASHLLLNVGAIRDAIRFRPDLVLGAHIIVAPAAALIQRVAGAALRSVPARPRGGGAAPVDEIRGQKRRGKHRGQQLHGPAAQPTSAPTRHAFTASHPGWTSRPREERSATRVPPC